MIHNIRELFKVYGCGRPFIATEGYINRYNIPISSRGSGAYAVRLTYRINNGKPVNLFTTDSVTKIYFFGEKTWFDTEEELHAHRAQYQTNKTQKSRYYKAMAEIQAVLDNMTIEELEAFAENIKGR